MIIKKPNLENFNAYFNNYVELVETDDLLMALESNLMETLLFFKKFSGAKENQTYAYGKWTVKEVLSHIIDVERIFSYRAFRFSRQDTNELNGYDDELFVKNSNSNQRNLSEMLEEFYNLRKSTISLFSYFDSKMLDFEGLANKNVFTPRLLGFVIVGHTIHHSKVVEERY